MRPVVAHRVIDVFVDGLNLRILGFSGVDRKATGWPTRRLAPDPKTIADLRKNNGRAIREVWSHFVIP